jgi:hypothetical protein
VKPLARPALDLKTYTDYQHLLEEWARQAKMMRKLKKAVREAFKEALA